jgi:hypothetical protein
MISSLPPLHEITKNVGIELPEFLGKLTEQTAGAKVADSDSNAD